MIKLDMLSPDYVFESSWEVCNKVGGIYTVLSTKAQTLKNLYKDNLIFIGPDLYKDVDNPDFIEHKTLLKAWTKHVADNEKLHVRVGRWNVPGKPVTILVDFTSLEAGRDRLFHQMWERFRVDSLAAYGDYDESCLFAYATGLVIESLYKFLKLENKNVIAHMNEWMLGMGGLYLQDKVPAIATIFTTHATSIGRSIAGNNKPLYREFNYYNGDQMARELNMEAKHSLEKQAAHHADCFTTVSDLTAQECTQLLDKAPDIVTPNGFESNFVPTGKNFEKKRTQARNKLIDVAEHLLGETVPSDAVLLAISGRYEYKNKGIDLFIETINRVKYANPDKHVIAFILVPAWINGPRADLQGRLEKETNMKAPLFKPYYTHELNYPDQDKVLEYMNHLHLFNQKEYTTKLIFVPSYLNGSDGIFNLSYYDLLIGLDMTLFPSYYEPWGYTPLESIAFHVPTMTTNFAGFGLWAKLEGSVSTRMENGVVVIERNEDNYLEVAEEMKDCILKFTEAKDERISEIRQAALVLSEKAAWKHFIVYYLEAYHIALVNAAKRNGQLNTNE